MIVMMILIETMTIMKVMIVFKPLWLTAEPLLAPELQQANMGMCQTAMIPLKFPVISVTSETISFFREKRP